MNRILVVDDEAVARARLQDVLRQAGFTVEAVEDWVGLSQRFLDDSYDLVLLDIGLPGISGDQLVREIRALATPPPAVLLHSVLEEEELRRISRRTGADGFLTKGATDALLLTTIEACLRHRARQVNGAAAAPAPEALDLAAAAEPSTPPAPSVGLSRPPRPPAGFRAAAARPEWHPRLLIVDDSRARRSFLEGRFRDLGYPTALEDGGQAALGYLDLASGEARPDVILSDVHMPEMDGFELAAAVHDRSDYAQTPVILYSSSVEALQDDASREKARRASGGLHLTGVVAVDDLVEAVERRRETLDSLRRLERARRDLQGR